MTTDSDVRVCVNCGSEIPKWKAKGTSVCSAKCKFEIKEKKKGAKKATKYNSGSLLHACLFNILDAPKSCLCHKRLTDKQAQKMISAGEAVDFKSRLAEYVEGAPLLVAGKHLKFPRGATVERPHIERLTDHHSSKDTSDQSLDEARKAIEEDRALRGQEEIVRLQIYGELTAELRRRWIVELPADKYDEAEREARGRCLFSFGYERTEGGIGVDVDPRSLAPLAPIETKDQGEAEAVEAEAVENVVVETNETESESPENESGKREGDEISLDDVIQKESEQEELEEEFV